MTGSQASLVGKSSNVFLGGIACVTHERLLCQTSGSSIAVTRHGIGPTLLCRRRITNNGEWIISREQTQPETPSPSTKEPMRSQVSVAAIPEPNSSSTSPASRAASDLATIGKSLQIKGELTGSESLYIDGNVEGAINMPDSRVTVGREAQVSANITAREVVVLGKVSGNVYASDRVDIRSEGSLTGDVTAQRISIGDGAFFRGGIDIRTPGHRKNGMSVGSSDHSQRAPAAVHA